MDILVTGGSGFLGTRLISKLLDNGHAVFALARSNDAEKKVLALGAVPIRGILDGSELPCLPKVDAIVHAGAYFRFSGPRAPYFKTNVDGTLSLLSAAEQSGASIFVYISAAGIIMDNDGSPIRKVDESAETFPNSFSGYLASKASAEALVLSANRPGFRTIALRPPAIWGPGDTFSRELPRVIKSGQFAFIKHGNYAYDTCHVDNVIEAVSCALIQGTGGRAYFINDRDKTTFRKFVSDIANLQGLSIEGLRSMPYRLAFVMGRLMEIGATFSRSEKDPPLSRTMVRMIGREFTTDDTAARRELAYVGKVSRADGIARYRA